MTICKLASISGNGRRAHILGNQQKSLQNAFKYSLFHTMGLNYHFAQSLSWFSMGPTKVPKPFIIEPKNTILLRIHFVSTSTKLLCVLREFFKKENVTLCTAKVFHKCLLLRGLNHSFFSALLFFSSASEQFKIAITFGFCILSSIKLIIWRCFP